MIFQSASYSASKALNTLAIVFTFISTPILSQFSGYTLAESSAYNAGLHSNGTGLKDPMANFGGNPAFLISHNRNIIDVGAGGVRSQAVTAPVVLNGGGFYILSENLGIGVRLKPVYTRFFPTNDRLTNYTGQALISYKLNDQFFFGFGIGPSVSSRAGGYSSYSWNAFGSIGVLLDKVSFGIVLESPGANRFENYLGTEKLKERYPERISLGIQYDLFAFLFLYAEATRTFWERAVFSQNGYEEKPPFPIRTMFNGSLGMGYKIGKGTELLIGMSQFANPTNKGSLDPVIGFSGGIKSEILPSLFGPGIYGSLYLQRTGIRRTLERYESETRFGFQMQSLFDLGKNEPK